MKRTSSLAPDTTSGYLPVHRFEAAMNTVFIGMYHGFNQGFGAAFAGKLCEEVSANGSEQQ